MAGFPGITHVALTVSDLDRSRAFYDRLFDSVPVLDEDTGSFYHAVYSLEDGTLFGLHTHPTPNDQPEFREFRSGLDHVAFGVASRADLERWAERLDGLGIAHGEIVDAPYGSGLSFRDPDNIALEFFAPRLAVAASSGAGRSTKSTRSSTGPVRVTRRAPDPDRPSEAALSKQVLNEQTYSAAHTQELTGGRPVTKTMTYGGTIVRSLFLIIITLGFAAVGWQWAARVATTSGLWFFLGYILLIALTFAAVNNPRIAAIAGIVYAALMGTWMGSISRIYETYYQGIVGQALLTTVCVFIACLLLYSLRVVRVTGKFIRVLIISIFGITLLYLFGWFVSIFGVRLNFLYNGSTTGIAISVVICIVAAMSLIADFAVVETGVKSGAPAEFEWYAAFGLQTTLVWLYLEILYLLARTRNG